MRLQKVLADAGVASRRKAEAIIAQGRVRVNGRIVKQRGSPVDPAKDSITLDGNPIYYKQRIYLLLNKPKGYICTTADTHFRKTVSDLIDPAVTNRIFPVGRLDKNTSGVLLLTDDGELTYRLTHPKFGVWKTYEALVRERVDLKGIDRLKKGVLIEGRRTAPAKVRILVKNRDQTRLQIQIHQGWKRQVRLMLKSIGHPAISLRRTAFGNLSLRGLGEGESRKLTEAEVLALKKLVGMEKM